MFDLGGMSIDVNVEMGAVTGPRGEKGETGKGFQIEATFATLEELKAYQSPEKGDFYNVGTEPPYEMYLYDGKDYVSQGKLQGPTGADGFSPTVTGEKQDGVLTLTVTDRNGEQTYTVTDGKSGKDGADGKDGFAPVIETAKADGVTTVTITTADGVKTAQIADGKDGAKGENGPNTVDTTTATTLDGLMKGNGATVAAAVPGVDFPKFGKGWTVTLAAANWTDSNAQSVAIAGMPADTTANCVFVSPVSMTDKEAWAEADIWSAQEEGAISFACANKPATDIAVNVWLMEGVAG